MKEVHVNTFYPSHPHAAQKRVLAALDSGTRFVQLRAGRKWRKTSLMVSWLFEKALATGLTCPYVAPNRIQAKNIAWDDHVQRLLNGFTQAHLPYKKNESELSVKLPNGGKVQLMGVENQEALRGISNWGAFAGDEYDDWAEDIFPTIIRPNLITHKAPAIIGGTPKGFRNLYKLEQGGIFTPFHFTSMENPDLDPEELEALKQEYLAMGMGTYRQEILAEYEKPEGTVYEEWDRERQYLPLLYDPYLPVHVTWDFGINDPTAVVVIQPHGREIRVIDYYEASEAKIKHFADWLDHNPYKRPEIETGDIAGRARSLGTGKSVITELRTLGHTIRTMPIPDIPSQIRNAHRSIPHLYVSNSTPNTERFVECLLNYKYPKKAATVIDQSNEIPLHDEFSHAMRAFEYYCWNLLQGKVGGFTEGSKTQAALYKPKWDQGQQIAINIDRFRR